MIENDKCLSKLLCSDMNMQYSTVISNLKGLLLSFVLTEVRCKHTYNIYTEQKSASFYP